MAFRYTLEILAIIAICSILCIVPVHECSMNGAEFAGSDNEGSGLVAELHR